MYVYTHNLESFAFENLFWRLRVTDLLEKVMLTEDDQKIFPAWLLSQYQFMEARLHLSMLSLIHVLMQTEKILGVGLA